MEGGDTHFMVVQKIDQHRRYNFLPGRNEQETRAHAALQHNVIALMGYAG